MSNQKKSTGGWGSLLSGAVANLESRLDTILAEDGEASARQRASEAAMKEVQAQAARAAIPPSRLTVPATASREASRSRANEKLAERLAKATARKDGAGGSGGLSRTATPTSDAATPSTRTSEESPSSQRISLEAMRSGPLPPIASEDYDKEIKQDKNGSPSREPTLLTSGLPINPAQRSSEESTSRLSSSNLWTAAKNVSSAGDVLPNGAGDGLKTSVEWEAELERMRQAEIQRQEEMHGYIEKIDALQAKLAYLAKETVAAAQQQQQGGNLDARLAEKDARIALLMAEGETLSKTELRHRQTIKQLRAQTTADARAVVEAQKKAERAEDLVRELQQQVRRAEAAEREAAEKMRVIVNIEREVDELRKERESAAELIRGLHMQLRETTKRGQEEERWRLEVARLENEVEDARIEKTLAEERAREEVARLTSELERQKERVRVRERELQDEIAALEAQVEAVRARAEEAASISDSTTEVLGIGGGGGALKLLRQIETLQSQYAQARENWETIEGSLNARLAAVEAERDEAGRREAEVRRKAREAGGRTRKAEEELEAVREQGRELGREAEELRAEVAACQARLNAANAALADSRAEAERQRQLLEAELAQRVEEERMKCIPTSSCTTVPRRPMMMTTTLADLSYADPSSNTSSQRRPSTRLSTHDLPSLHTSDDPPPPSHRSTSRRRSTLTPYPTDLDSSLTGNLSSLSLADPPGPSISNPPKPNPTPSTTSTPTLPSLLSPPSTTGPTVQLVSRLSAHVRRLESEKSALRDDLARLAAQRDEARDEVVGLLRETSRLRGEAEKRRAAAERYDACLEMLGEREEEVEELKADVSELKRMYRELVEAKLGPGPGPAGRDVAAAAAADGEEGTK
ncbi:hypothetical protein M433DRAFT_361322 [Acidomyces richmondensis BFW]|nr:MAG: hypothetical protein FE78DRAFT_194705 [Acidomyces sp. 'richmondensis']KYG49045.1 hypothetical protein M433DRAFT_361322 [Acidomyces richmondensis BFW]